MKKNMLAQFESNEVICLMYLAGELPPEDRAEIEQLLKTDGGLRAELERVREMDAALRQKLGEADRQTPLATDSAMRGAIRAMHQWHAEKLRKDAAAASVSRSIGLPRWSYVAAAAAAVLLGVAVWVANMAPAISTEGSRTQVAYQPDFREMAEDSALPVRPLDDAAVAEQLAASFDDTDRVLAEAPSHGRLWSMASQVRELQSLSEGMDE